MDPTYIFFTDEIQIRALEIKRPSALIKQRMTSIWNRQLVLRITYFGYIKRMSRAVPKTTREKPIRTRQCIVSRGNMRYMQPMSLIFTTAHFLGANLSISGAVFVDSICVDRLTTIIPFDLAACNDTILKRTVRVFHALATCINEL